MKTTQRLHELGQSLCYFRELSVTGLTSNPTIFGNTIRNSQDEDARSFVKSWKELLECIASKSQALEAAG
jgi:transaldolase